MNAKNDTPSEGESTEPATEPNAESGAALSEPSAPAAPDAEAPEVQPATTGTEKPAEVPANNESPAATGDVAAAPVQTVYVTAPTPPKPKGNRGVGTLLSFVAAIVFAAVYAGVAALLILFVNPNGVMGAVTSFVTSPLFFVPTLVFLVMMILWTLLANRASWWSWVIGSLIIAVFTYFASIGVLLLLAGGFGLTASQATASFLAFAVNPVLIAAGLIGRECAIWFGAAIAKRGRKVRERNYAAWQAFEHEETQKRAEFGGAATN
ncbi:MAG: hypothetical protein IT190_02530 [Microbacteriaceae bacterium]|nr:hypothetical protein [Microbacteriaceae bacterium]